MKHDVIQTQVNEYWLWRKSTGWVLHVRPYSRAELDAIERAWGRT